MSQQSMPVLALLNRRGTPVLDAETMRRVGPQHWSHANIKGIAQRAMKIDVQVVWDLMNGGKKRLYDPAADFSNLRLPYPEVWFEYQNGPLRTAVYATEEKLPDGRYRLVTRTVHAAPNGRIAAPSMWEVTWVNEAGDYLKGVWNHDYGPNRTVHEPGHSAPAYLALSLIHCKNVQLAEQAAESQPVARVAAKRRKPTKRPTVRYHTIILPGMNPSQGHRSGENRDIMALHRVRGHFKTYTAEAPLLGRYTGTYWWGWQVRGNKKNGVVVSDYKVGTPANPQESAKELQVASNA